MSPIFSRLQELRGAAIMTCSLAGLSCCCCWLGEAHLRKRKELWVQLSKRQHGLIRTNMTPRRKCKLSSSAPNRQEAACGQHFNNTYVLFHSPSHLKCRSGITSFVTWLSQTNLLQQVCLGVWECVCPSGFALLYLLGRTVRSSCADSYSGHFVGRTVPCSHTGRFQHSLARNDSHCSLMPTYK